MKKNADKHGLDSGENFSRRAFVSRSTAALSGMLVAPRLVSGAAANSKIAVGLIGCGGRGAWIGSLFK